MDLCLGFGTNFSTKKYENDTMSFQKLEIGSTSKKDIR
ncbi:hypothetical protein LEP1GSC032_1263 [Leptospira interrogans str. 2002000631]|uniref:Uncharacterized protein n=3 Tax=Leptospira interrogans TaxID=173 RepID=A0A0E2CYW9_LEPIR|nr:hypothetical protein G436_0528 [Leptospira interrogans serovar Hardjo str. Norma]EJP15358.1 hypothetical protein LEP1GSC080_3718 [Leptospira interrogans str. FPW2026]EKN87403.1 hypothetical protein LEP1GSC027_3004 [Leptospira interrogans str. 2002000624]EKQ37368.1 hypothetical protein LEP1GSC025_0909 [Leptospira interrogans str. 2002000621]EKQ47643.1 hypothetical protein LEP1GSC026_4396 [Leptospira interrogans str. 2002000623]EKR37839.1 hypothetical protein LEP1GSC096_1170 [Leptospira inter